MRVPRMTEVFRRILEADFRWDKFPPLPSGGGYNPMGSKDRDVSKVGPGSSNKPPGDPDLDDEDHESMDFATLYKKKAAVAQDFDEWLEFHDASSDPEEFFFIPNPDGAIYGYRDQEDDPVVRYDPKKKRWEETEESFQ